MERIFNALTDKTDEELRVNLVEQIRARRKKLGISKTDVSFAAGIDKGNYSKFENAIPGKLSMRNILVVCDTLGMQFCLMPKKNN